MSWVFYTSAGVAKTSEYIGSEFPIGTIVSTGGATAPTNWLLCDGAAVSRTTYADLFTIIGTAYGVGNGTTTFNVPDSTGTIIYATKLATRVTSADLSVGSAGSITSAMILDGTIATADIAANAVTSAKLATGATSATYVTTLPSSPVDGQEVYYQSTTAGTGGGASNSMATVGAVWHLRYRSAASGSYKWEFVGGGQLSALQTAGLTTVTATTYATDAGAPVITVPVAGDYDVTFSAQAMDNQTAAYQALITAATAIPSNAVGDPLSAMYRQETNAGVNVMVPASRTVRLTGLAASASLATYQRVTGGTGRYFNRSLMAVPIRVG